MKYISAGFGFLHEKTRIPPYNCLFSTLTENLIRERSNELNIEKDLINFLNEQSVNYDLIYLALGIHYFRSINSIINEISEYGKQIVHFVKFPNPPPNYVFVDSNQLVKDSNNLKIDRSIGSLMNAKGTILENYSLHLKSQKGNFSQFSHWLNDISSK